MNTEQVAQIIQKLEAAARSCQKQADALRASHPDLHHIDTLRLTVPTYNRLARAQVKTVGQLRSLSDEALSTLVGWDEERVREVQRALKAAA